MNKWLSIIFGLLLPMFFTPVFAEDEDCSAKRIVERIDSAYQDYRQARTALNAGMVLEQAKLFYNDVGKLIGDCHRVVDTDESSFHQTVELRTQSWARNAGGRTMKNGCEVVYVEKEYDTPVILLYLLGEKSIRKIRNFDVYDSDMEALEVFQELESEANGRIEYYAVYLNPEHKETYSVQYEYEGDLYEVKFTYDRGITGKRNTLGAIFIQC